MAGSRGGATFARRVFTGAGIYGVLLLAPMYFLERRIGELAPPAITHVENFYGFLAVTLAWQVAFLVIGRDPLRFRPLMPVAMLEKAGYVVTIALLLALDRIDPSAALGAAGDLVLLVLFVAAYRKTAGDVTRAEAPGAAPSAAAR
ncbi:MAG TPA: hypothetical protein VFS40_16710 [Gemmatimonadales bacterium]|nr:hypothetical protein [Gemmatimonadales bacterium]